MKKNYPPYPALLTVLLVLTGAAAGLAAEKKAPQTPANTKPRHCQFETANYHLDIWRRLHWGIAVKSGDQKKGFTLLWPWPIENSEAKAENQRLVTEEKEGRFSAVITGQTAQFVFRGQLEAQEREIKFTYEFEARQEIPDCRVCVSSNGRTVAGLNYEWGARPDLPEGIGCFDAVNPEVDRAVSYFKIFDLNGRQATWHFTQPLADFEARQWHRYRLNPKNSIILFALKPFLESPILPGKRGRIEFSLTIE